MKIELKFLDARVNKDQHVTVTRNGIELCANIAADLILPPGAVEKIHTGIAVHISDSKVVGLMVPRSGEKQYTGLVLSNLIGLIDSDYQGELIVSAWNRGEQTYIVSPGEYVARLLFVHAAQVRMRVVLDFESKTTRGADSFGSTGTS